MGLLPHTVDGQNPAPVGRGKNLVRAWITQLPTGEGVCPFRSPKLLGGSNPCRRCRVQTHAELEDEAQRVQTSADHPTIAQLAIICVAHICVLQLMMQVLHHLWPNVSEALVNVQHPDKT